MKEEIRHLSDCSVHNEPAYPAGPCDCGGVRLEGGTETPVDREAYDRYLERKRALHGDRVVDRYAG